VKSNTLTNKLNCRKYDEKLGDFIITTIKGETPSDPYYWGIYLNFQPTSEDGCQQKQKVLKQHDNVLFAYIKFNIPPTCLRLSGPELVLVNTPVILVVTDEKGMPVPFARVFGQGTNGYGRVQLTFTVPTIEPLALKAEKANWIRSNVLRIMVLSTA
jgi:hypothetical protein